MDIRGLAESLAHETLEKGWEQAAEEVPEATPTQRTQARQFVAALHEAVLRSLQDAPDGDERTQAVVMHYIHLKSQWMLLNRHTNFLIVGGKIDSELMLRAALLAPLVAAVEANLPSYILAHIRRFLGNPEGAPVEITEPERLSMEEELERARVAPAEPDLTPEMFPEPTRRGRGKKEPDTVRGLQGQVRQLRNTITDLTLRMSALQTEYDIFQERTREREAAREAQERERQAWANIEGEINAPEREALEYREEDGIAPETVPEELPETVLSVAVKEPEAPDTRKPEPVPETEPTRRIRELTDTVTHLRAELRRMEADWDRLLLETGQNNTGEVVSFIRDLTDALRGDTVRYRKMLDGQELLQHEFGDVSAKEIIIRFRTLAADLAGKDKQYAPLMEGRDLLERELGSGEAAQVLRVVRNLRDKIFAAEQQVSNLNRERGALLRDTGCYDMSQVTALVRRANDSAALLRERISQMEVNNILLEAEFGTTNAAHIVAHYRELCAEATRLSAIQIRKESAVSSNTAYFAANGDDSDKSDDAASIEGSDRFAEVSVGQNGKSPGVAALPSLPLPAEEREKDWPSFTIRPVPVVAR